jgi:hypothetical protein
VPEGGEFAVESAWRFVGLALRSAPTGVAAVFWFVHDAGAPAVERGLVLLEFAAELTATVESDGATAAPTDAGS